MTGIRAFSFTPGDGVPPGVAPFAHATAAGQTLYVTGQMPTDVSGTVRNPQRAEAALVYRLSVASARTPPGNPGHRDPASTMDKSAP